MGKFGLQSKATEVCQKSSSKNTQFEWNVFLHQTAKACKEFQLKAKSTSSVEEQENQAGREQWRWTVALSLSWWAATAKHDWNEMKIPFRKNMFQIILKDTEKQTQSRKTQLSKQFCGLEHAAAAAAHGKRNEDRLNKIGAKSRQTFQNQLQVQEIQWMSAEISIWQIVNPKPNKNQNQPTLFVFCFQYPPTIDYWSARAEYFAAEWKTVFEFGQKPTLNNAVREKGDTGKIQQQGRW